jgi:outer membrane scaffolding protein for murein synthesis (MipA/OmpV family)
MLRALIALVLAAPGLALAQPPEAPLDASENPPLWEAGLVVAGATLPDYPGADRTQLRAFPFPFFIYRGKNFRTDNGGLRGRYRFSTDTELDLSFGGALPVGRGNTAREGMPELDFLLEAGPRLNVVFWRREGGASASLLWPARVVFSTDLSNFEHQGFLTAPELAYSTRRLGGSQWRARFSAGAILATEPLMDFFYGVSPEFATPTRPAYVAEGGLLETRFTVSAAREFSPRFSLFTFGRLSSLDGTANTASPLVRERLNVSLGLGIAYTFRRSQQRVSPED